ncbi:hypothetical protein PG990_010749 [Apiospora arundinis]
MPNSSAKESDTTLSIEEMSDGMDQIPHRTGSTDSFHPVAEPSLSPAPPQAPAPPPPVMQSRRAPPSGTVQDASDPEMPTHSQPAAESRDPKASRREDLDKDDKKRKNRERRRESDTGDPSGDYVEYPLPVFGSGPRKFTYHDRVATNKDLKPPGDDQAGLSSDAMENAGPKRRPSRYGEESAIASKTPKGGAYKVGHTEVHGMRRPQVSYPRQSAQSTFTDGPSRPIGEMMAPLRQPRIDRIEEEEDFDDPYAGEVPMDRRPAYPAQPLSYVQPSYAPYYPVSYGNPAYSMPPYIPPPPPPRPWYASDHHAEVRAPPPPPPPPTAPAPAAPEPVATAPVATASAIPAPAARSAARLGTHRADSELMRVMKELEDNRNALARKDDIIKEYRVKELETEMLHSARETVERANKREEQAKTELETLGQKRLEEQKQELARLEYENKILQAAQETRERMEQKLRDEETIRKAEEQRLLGLEMDMRRRIESEMAEEQERRKREVEKRMYLEREIREKIMAERREQEEMTLREELRKQHIEKRLEHEFELKRRRADELQQYKENIEARLRMEAHQIIGSEKRKLDMEMLRLEIQQGTERVIRETMTSEGGANLHGGSLRVEDFLDPDQSQVNFDPDEAYRHSQMDSRHVRNINNQDDTVSLRHNVQDRNSKPGTSPLAPAQVKSALSSPGARPGFLRPGWEAPPQRPQTMNGRPGSLLNNLGNYSNPFAPQLDGHNTLDVFERLTNAPPITTQMNRQRRDGSLQSNREDEGHPFAPNHYSSHIDSQQYLHMPTPTNGMNRPHVLQEMSPGPAPSDISSDLNIRYHADHYVATDRTNPELRERNLKPEPRSAVGSSLQPYVESESGSEVYGASPTFKQRLQKTQMSPDIGGSRSSPCQILYSVKPHVKRTPAKVYQKSALSSVGSSQALEDSGLPRAQLSRDYDTSPNPGNSPTALPEPGSPFYIVPSPPPPEPKGIQGYPPSGVQAGLYDRVQHSSAPRYKDSETQTELGQEDEHVSLEMSPPIAVARPVSERSPSLQGSTRSSYTKEKQLKRMKKFSREKVD